MVWLKKAAVKYPLVFVTLAVGALVLGLWVSGLGTPAQIVATIWVGLVVVWTVVQMVRDMLQGNFGLDVLAVMAMIATLAVGEYGASLVIVLMLTGGEALEDYAANRAKSALTDLLRQTPQTAHRVTEQAEDAQIQDVPAAEVAVGDHLIVRPGEVVPVDAVLDSVRGSFDEAALTGEPLPVERARGDEVPSGAINGDEAVQITALRTAQNSQYQQIVALVADAEDNKAPVVRVADRFAVPFTVISLLIAGIAWIVSGEPVRFAEVLVLATPCPLLIAAPVAFMGGLSRGAKNGVIFKGGAVMESLARVRSAAFDKTGTITGGRPEVVRVLAQPGFDASEVLALAASAEQYSGHILAQGIVSAAKAGPGQLRSAERVEETAGSGVNAEVGGHAVLVGSRGLAEREVGAPLPRTEKELRAGEVATYVCVDGVYAGTIVLADHVRQDAAPLVSYLREQGVENIEMLTGDSAATAEQIGAAAGISVVRAGLRPAQKVQSLRDLQPKPTVMVGDGVNDAPALATADVGIAMGARGATAAGEAAGVVIVPDSVWKVADGLAISRQTMRVALTSIWIGMVLSVGLMLVATTGVIPAMVGALTQEFVDLAAILYALRALRGPLPERKRYSAEDRGEHLAQTGQRATIEV